MIAEVLHFLESPAALIAVVALLIVLTGLALVLGGWNPRWLLLALTASAWLFLLGMFRFSNRAGMQSPLLQFLLLLELVVPITLYFLRDWKRTAPARPAVLYGLALLCVVLEVIFLLAGRGIAFPVHMILCMYLSVLILLAPLKIMRAAAFASVLLLFAQVLYLTSGAFAYGLPALHLGGVAAGVPDAAIELTNWQSRVIQLIFPFFWMGGAFWFVYLLYAIASEPGESSSAGNLRRENSRLLSWFTARRETWLLAAPLILGGLLIHLVIRGFLEFVVAVCLSVFLILMSHRSTDSMTE
ncbi:MAG: hypothetical protein KDK30_07615 [Leptospiraceae bacterium]|nr:hypothetical protein [Leptospiraceae bacterium]MCB1315569.1 hypothetical protein [Leptospiraceae bacterium]MCB1319523.1 hypothetical protein [Leptospiraceae bacterium]